MELADTGALKRCLAAAKARYIFYLAAATRRTPKPSFADAFGSVQEDLLGLLQTIAAVAEAPVSPVAFVRAGTLAAYGKAPMPHLETQREMPCTTYAAALVAGQLYVEALQPRLAFPVLTARLSLVFGPGQSGDFLIPSLIRKCLVGEPSIVRRPNERRDLLFVRDAVEGLYQMANICQQKTPLVNIASGYAPTMREVATLIVEKVGVNPTLVEFPQTSASDDVDLCPSPALADAVLGWKALVPWRDGIARTIEWARKHT